MATYQVLYWRHLPMRVRATDINGQKSAELSPRFMKAMNEAAKQPGVDGGTVMFRWSSAEEMEGSAEEVLERVIKQIDEEFPGDIPLNPPEEE